LTGKVRAMDDLGYKTMLYDFYGNMMTKRQKEVYEEYYLNDLSLGEIAQKLNISRAAVHDNIKRSEKALENYEQSLGLIHQFQENQLLLGKILSLTEEADAPLALQSIRGLVSEVLKNL